MKLDGWLLAVWVARACMTSVLMTYAAVVPVLRTQWGMSATAAGSISWGLAPDRLRVARAKAPSM